MASCRRCSREAAEPHTCQPEWALGLELLLESPRKDSSATAGAAGKSWSAPATNTRYKRTLGHSAGFTPAFHHRVTHTSLQRFAVPWLRCTYRTVLCFCCGGVAPEYWQSCWSFQALQSKFTVPQQLQLWRTAPQEHCCTAVSAFCPPRPPGEILGSVFRSLCSSSPPSRQSSWL